MELLVAYREAYGVGRGDLPITHACERLLTDVRFELQEGRTVDVGAGSVQERLVNALEASELPGDVVYWPGGVHTWPRQWQEPAVRVTTVAPRGGVL